MKIFLYNLPRLEFLSMIVWEMIKQKIVSGSRVQGPQDSFSALQTLLLQLFLA